MDKKHYNCFTYQLKQSRGQRKTTKTIKATEILPSMKRRSWAFPQKKMKKKVLKEGQFSNP